LRFAFLEGGVGWASQLFGELIEHWERRIAKALERMHPDKVQAAPGHDVCFVPNDPGGCLFDVHQREKPERPLGMVKEEIDIGVFSCLAPHGRAEQVEMLDSEPLQLGFVLLQFGNSFAPFHWYLAGNSAHHSTSAALALSA